MSCKQPTHTPYRIGTTSVFLRQCPSWVTVDGAPEFEVVFRNGSAANPFHVFFLRLDRSAEIAVTITDEAGRTACTAQRVSVV